jgi:hypothetical protein
MQVRLAYQDDFFVENHLDAKENGKHVSPFQPW